MKSEDEKKEESEILQKKSPDSNGYRIWNHFSLIGRWELQLSYGAG